MEDEDDAVERLAEPARTREQRVARLLQLTDERGTVDEVAVRRADRAKSVTPYMICFIVPMPVL